MRYDDTHGFVSLDGAELRGGAAEIAVTLGALAPAPLGGGSATDREAWRRGLEALQGVARERAAKALARLTTPARVVEMHTASALGPHHLYFAWGQGPPGRLALLGVTERGYSLALRTASDLLASLQGALGLSAGFVGADLRTTLDAPAALALAAFLDMLRANRLLSEIRHRLALESASAGDVAARLLDARVADPRWPLCTLQKVLPLDLVPYAQEAEVGAALERLVAAGLLDSAAPSGALPALFSPAPALRPLVEESARAVAHVALSVFRHGPEQPSSPGASARGREPVARTGTLAYESALLLRGPLSLWLLSVAPPDGSLASLSPAAATQLLSRLATHEPPQEPGGRSAPTMLLPRVAPASGAGGDL